MWPPLVYLALVTTCTIWQTDVLAEKYNVTALIEEFKDIRNCVYTRSKKKDQCANRTEPHMMSPAFFDADMFRYSFCYCDAECHVFRDCCADVADFSNIDESQRRIADVPSNMWSCAAINVKRDNPNKLLIYMVTKCPEGHKYSDYCSRLSYPVDNTFNYMLDIARMDQESGVWYQNIYCALCHGVANHLAPINATLVCTSGDIIGEDNLRKLLPNATYQRENLTWEWQENEEETSNCVLQVTPDQWRQDNFTQEMTEFLPGVYRPCIALTDSCPSDWTDRDVAHKCHSFANYIMRILQDVYKNHYCALCNSVPVDKFMCWQPLTVRTITIGAKSNKGNLPSLSMVMDFDWNFRGEESWSENSKLCSPPHGIYDAIHKRCQPLDDICNKGYTFINNQCVYIETSDDESSINASCPKVKLNENQYDLLSNGSLKLVFESSDYHNRVFDAGFFGILIDGTAWVCMIFEKSSLIFSERAEGILTVICLTISIICICLHIITYSMISKLRNLPGKNLLALSCALLSAQLVFLLGVHPVVKVSRGVCRTIAMLIHYFFLASFFWMNVMGFDIWRKFRKAMHGLSPIRLHRKYAIYAWGSPALIILLSMLIDLKEILPQFARPNYARPNVKGGDIIYDNCWFGSPLGLGIFLALPVIIILMVNMFFFTTTVMKIMQQKQESTNYIKNKNREELLQAKSRNSVLGEVKNLEKSPIKMTLSGDKDKIRLYLYVKLFTIMGLTWIFGFIAALANVPILWYPFIISNGLQGAFIFVMFDCKRTIASAIWRKVFGDKYQIPEFLKTPKRSENSKSDTTNSISLTNRLRNMSNHRSSNTDTSRNSTINTSHEIDHDVIGHPDPQQTVRSRLSEQPVDGVNEKYRRIECEEE